MFEAKVILLERSIYELVVKLDTFMCMEREDSIDIVTEEDSHIGQFDGNETVSEEEISSMAEADGIDDYNLDNVLLNLPWWWKTSRKLKSEEFKEVGRPALAMITLKSEDCDSDSEDNDCWSERQERSSSSFDSSQKEGKEGSAVCGFFQNLILKIQNIDLSYYIERAIE